MGKFFVAGVFLGAAVTFSVMHFMKAEKKALSGDALDRELAQTEERAAAKARADAAADAKQALAKIEAGLKKEHAAALAKEREALVTLTGEKTVLEGQVKQARDQVAALVKEKEDLEKQLDAARKAGSKSDSPKGLLVRRRDLIDVEMNLWRTLGEASAALEQAKLGWPDVPAITKTVETLPGLAKEYAKRARAAKTFLEENSATLGPELGDLDRYRAALRGDDIKAINTMVEKIEQATKGMVSASVVVPADKDGWTDSGIYVKAGDIIQVRAKGAWKMVEHWPVAGPGGWDSGAQHKITQNARAGSLIARISISQEVSPAYLGIPIVADREGRVVLRMNDKDTTDNGGKVSVKVVSIDPKALAAAATEWRKLVGE